MSIKTLFLANTIFALIGALGLLLAPEQLMTPYNLGFNEATKFLSLLMGTFILGIATISYLARNLKDREAVQTISWGFIVAHLGAALVGLYYLLVSPIAPIIWVDIIIHFLFALGFYLKSK